MLRFILTKLIVAFLALYIIVMRRSIQDNFLYLNQVLIDTRSYYQQMFPEASTKIAETGILHLVEAMLKYIFKWIQWFLYC